MVEYLPTETGFDSLYWQYLGIIAFMEENPGLYGMDTKRAEVHKELEKHFPGQEEELSKVLHDLPRLRRMRPKQIQRRIDNMGKG